MAPWSRKPPLVGSSRPRVMTAAGVRLNQKDREQNKEMRLLRQGWQSDAWQYYDTVGEVRYGVNFLANCTARMKLYPAAYQLGGEDDNPAALHEIADVPDDVNRVCQEALQALGNGRLALSGLLHSLSTNTTVAGESFLLGEADDAGGPDTWTVRSIEEVVVHEDRYKLRELPTETAGASTGLKDLDPNLTVISRIWSPHPKFRKLALSPLRALLDDLESLLILRRMIRAQGRSRLASRGILFLPEELEIKTPENDSADVETQDFLGELTEAMMEGLADEGTAQAVVPITIQGPGSAGKDIRLIEFASTFDELASKTRAELVGVIATGLDLPKEVIMGVADLNHWSAWQVDDNTFRHHVEPHVVGCCDSLTAAYLRPFLHARGVDPAWVKRLLFWYDPTELVVHPDRSKDALDLHNVMAISDEALRREAGFAETDKPSIEEIQARQFQHIRTVPANLLLEWAHMMDPSLRVAPITQSGTVPGIDPVAGVVPAPAEGDGGPAAVGYPVEPTPPPTPQDPAPPAPGVTADGRPGVSAHERAAAHRLSRRLTAIDRDLRIRLQVAANAAVRRKLEQSGARLRSALSRHPDETVREAIKMHSNERLAAGLGETMLGGGPADAHAVV